jgi:hypothetical protein
MTLKSGITFGLYIVTVSEVTGLGRRSCVAVSRLSGGRCVWWSCQIMYLARKFFNCVCGGCNGGSTGARQRGWTHHSL